MIETLLTTLERQADAEIARVADEGRTRAAELAAAAEQRMATRRAQTLERREAQARAQLERALAAARRAARNEVLSARAKLLDRVFAAIRAELGTMELSKAYRAQLAPALDYLLRFAGTQAVTVRCSPALVSALRAVMKTNGRLRVQSDASIAAGFRLTTTDGALEIDATLEGRLERLRPQLALEALTALAS